MNPTQWLLWLVLIATLSVHSNVYAAKFGINRAELAARTILAQRPKKPSSPKTDSPSEQPAGEAAQQRAITAFEEGQRAHERGDLQKAVEQYSAALEDIPAFPEALYQRGMAYLALKQFDPAQVDLLRLAEMEAEILTPEGSAANPQLRAFFGRAHSGLGDIFTERGDPAKAEQNYRRAVELDPTLQRATTSLAALLMERKAFQEATALLRAAVDAGATSASVHSLLGFVYEQSHQPDLAMENYTKAIELEPRHRLARERRSHLRADRQDYAGAIDDMAVVYEQDSSATNALELGALYERAGKSVEAMGVYERALKNPAPPADANRLRLKFIEMLIAADRRDDALAQAQQWVGQNPNDAEALGRLGSVLLPVDPAHAAQAYLRALKLDQQNMDYQVGLSAALLKMKKFQDALSVSLDALKRAPENYYVRSNLATAYFELHDFAQAAEHFKWITDQRPTTAIAYYFLGICYDKLMNYEGAVATYERFLELADARQHQMEIDNVKFRLPGLRRLLEKKRGQRRR